MLKIAVGDRFRHRRYGFIGELICIDSRSHVHLIQALEGKEALYSTKESGGCVSFFNISNPSTLTWKGLEYQIEEDFENYPFPMG